MGDGACTITDSCIARSRCHGCHRFSWECLWIKYNNRYLIVSETDALGGVTLFEYDDVGRTTAVIDPDRNRTEYVYDDHGNLLLLTRSDGKKIAMEFNSDDKPVRIIDPNGAVWQQQWDYQGLLTSQVSPLGASLSIDTTAAVSLRIVNPRKALTEFTFDEYGKLTRLIDALGNFTSFAYDVFGKSLAVPTR